MRPKRALIFFSLILLISCREKSEEEITQYKDEIYKTEFEFAQMAKKEGIVNAFVIYADSSAVLNRNNNLIIGKKAIKEYLDKGNLNNIKLDWKPDFVDVSSSGDIGYTYGQYTYSAIDTTGKLIELKGIFHTVWKKQEDGSWKYVWD